MSISGAIRAGRAFIELFVDKKGLTAGLASASKEVTGFGGKLTQLGSKALGVSGIGGLGAMGIAIASLRKQTGPGFDELNARLDKAQQSVEGVAAKIGARLVPALEGVANAATAMGEAFEWAFNKINPGLEEAEKAERWSSEFSSRQEEKFRKQELEKKTRRGILSEEGKAELFRAAKVILQPDRDISGLLDSGFSQTPRLQALFDREQNPEQTWSKFLGNLAAPIAGKIGMAGAIPPDAERDLAGLKAFGGEALAGLSAIGGGLQNLFGGAASGAVDALANIDKQTSTAGTFNGAYAALALGTGKTAEQQLEEQKESNRLLNRIAGKKNGIVLT